MIIQDLLFDEKVASLLIWSKDSCLCILAQAPKAFKQKTASRAATKEPVQYRGFAIQQQAHNEKRLKKKKTAKTTWGKKKVKLMSNMTLSI